MKIFKIRKSNDYIIIEIKSIKWEIHLISYFKNFKILMIENRNIYILNLNYYNNFWINNWINEYIYNIIYIQIKK